jgi:hypothetical protein
MQSWSYSEKRLPILATHTCASIHFSSLTMNMKKVGVNEDVTAADLGEVTLNTLVSTNLVRGAPAASTYSTQYVNIPPTPVQREIIVNIRKSMRAMNPRNMTAHVDRVVGIDRRCLFAHFACFRITLSTTTTPIITTSTATSFRYLAVEPIYDLGFSETGNFFNT